MIIEYIPTFYYFSHYVDWKQEYKILDFGSNCGNLLKSSRGKINPKQYTGIDVDADSITEGKRLFPTANWVYYNRQNPAYNPDGENILPTLNEKYDLIISYSVFSHTSVEDMIETVEYLYSRLNSNGKLLFTICNVDTTKCVEWFRRRRINCDIVPKKDFVYLVDNKVADSKPKACTHFVTFYNQIFLSNCLTKYNPKINPAPGVWIQDCIEITKI